VSYLLHAMLQIIRLQGQIKQMQWQCLEWHQRGWCKGNA